MVWGIGGKVDNTTTKAEQNRTEYGDATPILSDYWKTAFANASAGLNANGFTSGQQQAYDWASQRLTNGSPVTAATNTANAAYDASKASQGRLIDGYNSMANRPAYQLGPTQQEAYVGDVIAKQGADFASSYYDPFLRQVVSSSVDDYNTNSDRALNQMRTSYAASGAYGGDRGAVAEGQFRADATRGLGSLVSNLYSQGFNTAQGLGQQDASRTLLADQGNQTARQGVNTRNTGLLDSRERANIGLMQDKDAQIFKSAEAIRSTLADQAKLTQQQLDNVVKADGIDVETAQAMFNAGTLSQEQLLQILQMSQAGNGSSFRNNSNTNTSGSSTTVGKSGGLSI